MTRLTLLLVIVMTIGVASGRSATERSSLELGGTPVEMVAAKGSIWILTCDVACSGEARGSSGRLIKVNAETGRVIATVRLRGATALSVGVGGVYVASFWQSVVRRLDPISLHVTAQLPLRLLDPRRRFAPTDIVAGHGAVWISTARGAVSKVDQRNVRVVALIRVPPATTGELALSQEGVWVAESTLGVYRIDPATNRVVARVPIQKPVRRFAVNRLIVIDRQIVAVASVTAGGALTRRNAAAWVEEATNRVRAVTRLPSGSLTTTAGAGSLWVAPVDGSWVSRLDPRTREVSKRYRVRGSRVIAVAAGGLWSVSKDGELRHVPIAGA